MAATDFATCPEIMPGRPRRFFLQIPEQDLTEFRDLVKLSKIGPATWWNKQNDLQFGISREWLVKGKEAWLNVFDWRKHEKRINSFPNFTIDIDDPEAGRLNIHFLALFSARNDATPIIFMHGWPGSFIEFLSMMDLLVKRYTPATLPYHIIVPSLPDYGFSSGPSHDVELDLEQAARIMNQLMVDLGFSSGYVAQGGDVGSWLARLMALRFSECKAFHLNVLNLNATDQVSSIDSLPVEERQHLERSKAWQNTSMAYAIEHGTRPATIGLVLSSNPLATLAWIGEKLIDWADDQEPLSLDTILFMVSFYWFTSTFPRSLYPYRAQVNAPGGLEGFPISKEKPLGYSAFPCEHFRLPRVWAEQVYPNLMLYKAHSKGGHFAALEQPTAFLEDIEKFIGKFRSSLTTKT
ncbi:Alpha/Beta hydrolase protein [Ilyonectria robusta]|uniref:Alpha/Beta hydrolase protein n=1 Tax=Ilyonectria robusta TaxID=1079257 RepID=UPI001E8D0EF8|nr:Alpha/Beta hydrolase protein [Ilyonectria robusta]KAH8650678.1 Alpha/Beta hydrolase protein [Ilyonectria robusta]